jgi:transcriptional regulator with XRE-family HTH domain
MTAWGVFVGTVSAEFGESLKRHREATGMTQLELASRLDLRRTSISNMESGNQVPSLPQLIAIAQALGIPPRELIPSVAAPIEAEVVSRERVMKYYSVRDEILKNAHDAT